MATRCQIFLALLCTLAGSACAPRISSRPSVVLIVLDTVRADRLSCYGYERPTTPRIDELAARGIRFANASSTSSWTIPAHASLFTGRYAIEHGATQEHTRLGPSFPTLAEILAGYGYATCAASANPLVSRVTGLERGFEHFEGTWRSARETARPDREAHPNLLAVRRFLERREAERPFFLFVNFMDAHSPYLPREPHRSRFLRRTPSDPFVASALTRSAADFYTAADSPPGEEIEMLSDLYDGEIAGLDEDVGLLIDELDRQRALDHTLLIVTSDHGENFGDHGHFQHLFSLHRSVVGIPLILLPPERMERGGQVRQEAVGLVDVFATILAAARVPVPGRHPGRNLLDDSGGDEPVAVFAEYYFPLQALGNLPDRVLAEHAEVFAPFRRRLRSVEVEGVRLVESSDGQRELYDLRRDPGESVDRADQPAMAARAERLGALLRNFVEEGGGDPPLPAPDSGPSLRRDFGELDAATEQQLRELGYLQE